MASRFPAAALGILALTALGLSATPQDDAAKPRPQTGTDAAPEKAGTKVGDDAKTPARPKIAKATFGGGCFWCTEAVFERIPGVKSVVSGYAGGNVPNPSYQEVTSGLTGHAEVVQVEFDPRVVSYEKLLDVFWASHDPTTLNSQGADFGTNYRSIILYSDEGQKKAAQKSYQDLKAKKKYRSPIVTELVPLTAFYPAEEYHQNYYATHQGNDYSYMNIDPKLRKLKLNKAPRVAR